MGLLAAGPPALTPEESGQMRYRVTDLLDDLIGSEDQAETLFITAELASAVPQLVLAHQRCWLGRGKWAVRAFRDRDAAAASEWTSAVKIVITTGNKKPLIALVERSLESAGGRNFEGWYVPGEKGPEAGTG